MKLTAPLKLMIAGLTALGVGTTLFFMQTRPDVIPLSPLAHKTIPLDSANPFYWWITGKEVLVFRDPARKDFTFVRQNLETGQQTPLEALTALYQQSEGKQETLRISPFGDWILWTGKGNTTWLSSLDGAKHSRVEEDGPKWNVWKCDGEGWFALSLSGENVDLVTEHSVKEPLKEVRPRAVASPFPKSEDSVNLDRIISTLDDRLIVPTWVGGKNKMESAECTITGFGANPMNNAHKKFAPPHENERGEIAFSSFSDMVAWRLEFFLPRAKFLYDLGVWNKEKYSVGLWITKQKTSSNVVIGYVDVIPGDVSSVPTNVQFSPSGSMLGFVYQNHLWTVPTE